MPTFAFELSPGKTPDIIKRKIIPTLTDAIPKGLPSEINVTYRPGEGHLLQTGNLGKHEESVARTFQSIAQRFEHNRTIQNAKVGVIPLPSSI